MPKTRHTLPEVVANVKSFLDVAAAEYDAARQRLVAAEQERDETKRRLMDLIGLLLGEVEHI